MDHTKGCVPIRRAWLFFYVRAFISLGQAYMGIKKKEKKDKKRRFYVRKNTLKIQNYKKNT